MYEAELAFLAKVENAADQTNKRLPLDPVVVDRIRQTFPGIPEDYLAYLLEIGPGSVRECQYMIYEAPMWCDEEPLFSWVESGGRKLLVFGDNFSGDLFVFDADRDYRVCELVHDTGDVLPFGTGFKAFIREMMLLAPDSRDQRVLNP